MHCCRHFITLLCIPTGGSAFFALSLLVSYTLQHRPCVYCTAILLILLFTSTYWRMTPFLDYTSLVDFFEGHDALSSIQTVLQNGTHEVMAMAGEAYSAAGGEGPGMGLGWLRRWLGIPETGELYSGPYLRVVL